MATNSTTLLTLVQETSDKNPLILGAVGVALGGLACLFLAFKNVPLVQKLSQMLGPKIKETLEKSVTIKVDPAHLADVQAVLKLVGKSNAVTSEQQVEAVVSCEKEAL